MAPQCCDTLKVWHCCMNFMLDTICCYENASGLYSLRYQTFVKYAKLYMLTDVSTYYFFMTNTLINPQSFPLGLCFSSKFTAFYLQITSREITKLVWIVGKHVHGATGHSCQHYEKYSLKNFKTLSMAIIKTHIIGKTNDTTFLGTYVDYTVLENSH